jgi:hypothetical protein
VDRSIKILQQLEQVFKSYRMMFKELKDKKKHLPNTGEKEKKILKHWQEGGHQVFADIYFSWGSWNLTS